MQRSKRRKCSRKGFVAQRDAFPQAAAMERRRESVFLQEGIFCAVLGSAVFRACAAVYFACGSGGHRAYAGYGAVGKCDFLLSFMRVLRLCARYLL